MAASSFALYRGTAHLFWADFSGDWRMARFGSPKTRTWLIGDMHIYNMGAFLNSEGQVCYGLNDFDESVVGDYQYDVWRLAISLVLTARQNKIPAVDAAAERDIVLAFGDAYLNTVAAHEHHGGGRTFTEANTDGPLKAFLEALSTSKDTSRKGMLKKMLKKDYTKFDYDKEKAKAPNDHKMEKPTPKEHAAVEAAFRKQYVESLVPDVRKRVRKQGWPDDIVLDVARRVNSGLGSLGMPRFYVLLDHRTDMHNREQHEEKLPIVVDVKLQGGGPRGRPTPYYFMDRNEKAEYKAMFANEGERHMRACRALTDATDPYLGYVTLPGQGTFSVRERTPVKENYPALAVDAKDRKDLLLDSRDKWVSLARSWGTILGRLHAHAPHNFDAKMGRFHFRKEVEQLTRDSRTEFGDLLWQVANDYARQVEQDYADFTASSLVPKHSRKDK
eukprot:TRINITY_DN13436_c0_g2_i1.p1 TRINITY_DN13436_c0_g2~~TRINITY_DN13436_c0_g2_i1.p1  ORF type:complete len:500 (-),score=182.61 TRINITY_DN13436_c0_g2_i1:604-1938(-)